MILNFSLSLIHSTILSLRAASRFLVLLICTSHGFLAWSVTSAIFHLASQGALVGLYADTRYKSGDDDKKELPLQSIDIIGGEVNAPIDVGT